MNRTAPKVSRRMLINAMRRYLDTVESIMKRGSEGAVILCDADVYSLILIRLAMEQLRAVVLLMAEGRPNFVGAAACARSAFELGIRGLWMCYPDDPQERMRRVAILDRNDDNLAEEVIRAGAKHFTDEKQRQISEYLRRYKNVVQQTTAQDQLGEVGNFPNFKKVLEEVGMGELYGYYRILSQFTHGGRASFYFVCTPTVDESSEPADFRLRSPSAVFSFGQFVKPMQWVWLASAAMAGVVRPTQAAFARAVLCGEHFHQQLSDAEDRFEKCLRTAYFGAGKPNFGAGKPNFGAALDFAHGQLDHLMDRAQPSAQKSRLDAFLVALAQAGNGAVSEPHVVG